MLPRLSTLNLFLDGTYNLELRGYICHYSWVPKIEIMSQHHYMMFIMIIKIFHASSYMREVNSENKF